MKPFFAGLWKRAMAHKFVAVMLAAIVLWGGYTLIARLTAATPPTKYIVSEIQKGTLLTTVSGTGQVASVNSLDIKPKVSGDVVRVPVYVGQSVTAGTVLVQLDTADLAKAVRDAQSNLVSAQISLKKLQEPADALSLTQAQNAITQATQNKQNAISGLAQAYNDGYTSVAGTFNDLPTIMTGMDSIINGYTVSNNQQNLDAYLNLVSIYSSSAQQLHDQVRASYSAARAAYNQNIIDYNNSNRLSSSDSISALIAETYKTDQTVAEAIKNTKTFLDLVTDILTTYVQNVKAPSALAAGESNLQSYTQTNNSDLSSLLNVENAIKSDKDAITNADLSFAEKTQALAKLQAGPDSLDVQSQQLAITQKQNALADAEQNLTDASVRAPFDGVVGKISVGVGDPASSGSSVVTLITNKQTANISLNEVDVAKVQLGQKANMTFDAVAGLTITGKVSQIDAIGAVSQGVVTYNVEITFDTQDLRIKPGMSVSADVITEVKQDVLVAPNSAVKTQAGVSYVETLSGITISADNGTTQTIASTIAPVKTPVQVGASSDSMTEITGGINEGDFIVTKTVATSTAATTNSAARSGLGGIPGLGGGR